MESSLSIKKNTEGKISYVMINLAGLFLMGRLKSHMGLLPDTKKIAGCAFAGNAADFRGNR